MIVASKSGSTLEPNILKQFFFDEMRRAVGAENVGSHFVAITDPGSKMEQVAKSDGFRYIFYGDPQIGGRYSALSNFGVVPATVAGLNIGKLLDEAAKAVAGAKHAVADNPGVQLGLLLGTAANAGRDKTHFLHLAGNLTIWARGWSNSSPNPPANRAKELRRWTAKPSARPRSTATTASLPTFA